MGEEGQEALVGVARLEQRLGEGRDTWRAGSMVSKMLDDRGTVAHTLQKIA
jgi:hypothetical protein